MEPPMIDGNTLDTLPIKQGQVLNVKRREDQQHMLPVQGIKALQDFDLYAECAMVGMDIKGKTDSFDWDVVMTHLISKGLATPYRPN